MSRYWMMASVAGLVWAWGGTGMAEVSPPARLSDVVVTAPRDSSHVTTSTGGTLIPADPVELPISVEILPQKVMESRYVTSLYDALEQTSGVFTGGRSTFTVNGGKPSIRGFGGNDVMLDGMVLPASMPIFFDAAALDGIEFYKGPLNSVQGGQSGLQGGGGGINMVSRAPDFSGAFYRMSLGGTFGNGASGRLTTDFNEILTDGLAARLPFAFTYEEPYYHRSGLDRDWTLTIAPAITWRPGEKTTLTLSSSYLQTERAAYQGIPYLKGDFLVPRDTYYGTKDTRADYKALTVQGRATHSFSDQLQLAVGAGYARAESERVHWSVSPNPLPADGMSLMQYYDEIFARHESRFVYSAGDSVDENYHGYARLTYDLDWGEAQHRLLLGGDWLQRESSSEPFVMGYTDWLALDGPVLAVPGSATAGSPSKSKVERTGLIVQDFASWREWRLLAGARFDYSKSAAGQHAWSTSPRLGVTWFARPELALFGNVTFAEGPNFGYKDINEKELDDPWRSEQFEAGTKSKLFDNLWLTLAGFQITQKNVPQLDPMDPTFNSYVLDGRNRSRGFEATLSGEFNEDWTWWGSYTFCKYKDLDEKISFERQPSHSASLWTAYRLPGGPLKGLQSGIGLRAKSKYYTTFRGQYLGDEFEIDPSVVVDMAFDYPLPWLSSERVATKLEFGVKNVFDESYVESNRHGSENFPGQPRVFWTRLNVAF